MANLTWSPAADAYIDVARIVVDDIVYTFAAGVPQQIPAEHVAAATTKLKAIQSTMAAPGAGPTVATVGTTGAATWGYKVAAVGIGGDTQLSAEGTATNGVATLTTSNKQRVTKPTLPAHATGWRVIRTTSGGTPATVNRDISGVIAAATTTFDDTGIAGSAYSAAGAAPPVDLVASGPADL